MVGDGLTTAKYAAQLTSQASGDVLTLVARHERYVTAERALVTGNATTSGHRYVVHFLTRADASLVLRLGLSMLGLGVSTTHRCHDAALLCSP